MTTILADTQIVLWAAGATDRLNIEVKRILETTQNDVVVSAISIAEMVIKQTIGKLSLPVPASELCEQLGFRLIALTPADCQRMGAIPLLHRDPFDRLLIAQALEQELTLITADHSIWDYPEVDLIRYP